VFAQTCSDLRKRRTHRRRIDSVNTALGVGDADLDTITAVLRFLHAFSPADLGEHVGRRMSVAICVNK
jgi:hypothetical protein